MVTINGEQVSAQDMTISAYLAQEGYEPSRVVVEYNRSILPRDSWNSTTIRDGDSIEILCFVGGG